MVSFATLEEQLKQIGCNFRFWGRSELRELCEILLPGEQIAQVVNGEYEAGFAMLCATDFRVLLIDKKPKYLTLKDIRFDMITELDYSNRLINSTIRIYTPNRELRFTTPSARRLRKLFNHVQHKVMEVRHRFMMQQFVPLHDMEGMPVGLTAAIGRLAPHISTLANRNPDPSDEQRNLAAAVGAAGLQGVSTTEGTVTAEYGRQPFTQRWRRRPYGYRSQSYQPE